MEHYLGVAKEDGLTGEEIGAVQSIVMAVAAGKVRAMFRVVRERQRENSKKQDAGQANSQSGDKECC